MRVTPGLCFFLFLFIVLMYSASGTALTAETRSQNQPQVMYGRNNRWSSSKVESQRRHQGGLHVVKHAGSGGRAINGVRPRSGHQNSANPLSIKSSSLFMAVFKHLIFGLLLVVCFY
ncbi:hypothetical protein QN277_007136 [Acacia crassicarpa]|uniref:Secreted protein n=1 Tax=Acacia crassicarpa TaxID=499986 RepID=A0AAE1IU41_9FABA|nr:hypothetical protein QN277_007136 [Acacia crassicarpa]